MKPLLTTLLGLFALGFQGAQDAGSGESGGPAEGAAPSGAEAKVETDVVGVPLLETEALVHWGDQRRIYFPKQETLKFRAKIKWGLSAPVGTVTMTTAMVDQTRA